MKVEGRIFLGFVVFMAVTTQDIMPVKAIVLTLLQTRHTIPCLETRRAMHRMCIVFRRGRKPHRKIPATFQLAVSNWTWNVFFGYFLCAKESNSRTSAKKIHGFDQTP